MATPVRPFSSAFLLHIVNFTVYMEPKHGSTFSFLFLVGIIPSWNCYWLDSIYLKVPESNIESSLEQVKTSWFDANFLPNKYH